MEVERATSKEGFYVVPGENGDMLENVGDLPQFSSSGFKYWFHGENGLVYCMQWGLESKSNCKTDEMPSVGALQCRHEPEGVDAG